MEHKLYFRETVHERWKEIYGASMDWKFNRLEVLAAHTDMNPIQVKIVRE